MQYNLEFHFPILQLCGCGCLLWPASFVSLYRDQGSSCRSFPNAFILLSDFFLPIQRLSSPDSCTVIIFSSLHLLLRLLLIPFSFLWGFASRSSTIPCLAFVLTGRYSFQHGHSSLSSKLLGNFLHLFTHWSCVSYTVLVVYMTCYVSTREVISPHVSDVLLFLCTGCSCFPSSHPQAFCNPPSPQFVSYIGFSSVL